MKTTLIIFLIITLLFSFVCIFGIIYSSIQIKRVNRVYKIREKWIDSHNNKYGKYSYKDMLKGNKNNWYGIKMPKEEDFK